MKDSSLVSIIIPCYNQANFLPESLNSVLGQTYHNWECIIVNDGSTDNTEEIALDWCKSDSRFIYLKKVNGGLSSARNVGLGIANGRFIQFLDSDDIIDIEKIELQMSALKDTHDLSLSYCDYYYSYEFDLKKVHPSRYLSPKFKTEDYIHELIINWESKLSIPCHCFLFNISLFQYLKCGFDESLPNHEDWDCWMQIFSLKPEVHYIDRKLAVYRIHNNSMCMTSQNMSQSFLKAIEKQRNFFKKGEIEYKLLSKRYNQIKYGFNSNNILLAFIIGSLKKVKRRVSQNL